MADNFNKRSAGILMHITSLPGNYDIGDFGREACLFADMMKQAGQHYWQLLPLNPIAEGKGYSPYSPLSAFAGNTLLISPDRLIEKYYLKELPGIEPSRPGNKVNYGRAVSTKKRILDDAYNYFCTTRKKRTEKAFQRFCEQESFWLDDYALFITIKRKLELPWWEWPEELRDRDPASLRKIANEYQKESECEKFAQFLFVQQWHELKTYCNENGIKIVGDIPIYISHDSADVWANPQFWKLDKTKLISDSAGVPPDYFNDKGQLWNMPVYNWKVLKKDRYRWWMQRLRKNLELFDIVRLDHFRGFSTYWEVKGGSEDAVKGIWKKGPARDFFDTLQKVFPEMPFIAEDLGDVDQAVYDLRDHYKLPGMRILQFAFGSDTPESVFIPHNYTGNSIVYTGTHDNNTVTGWYAHEAGKKGRNNLRRYLGRKITLKNCHNLMIRECYKSVARIAIIPMQDILGLGKKHRMNFPSTETGNWLWRMKKKQFRKKHIKELYNLSKIYGRI